ncbi:MAG TPA: phosphate ABC transporter permease subunit PstC, partial [Chitinophagaceae bacterium]
MKAVQAASIQKKIRSEKTFRFSLVLVASLLVIIAFGVLLTLATGSVPAIRALGISYLWGTTWDPVSDIYGALPFLTGTIITSVLAL